MRWFENYRTDWIAEMVRIYGFINREQIIRKFGVNVPTASRDLQNTLARYPNLMTYNATTKRYELVERPEPENAVRADGGCLYCDADQGEEHRTDCKRHPYSWQTSHVDENGVHQVRMLPNGDTERRALPLARKTKG
jgi:hypothetical protein